MRSIGRLFTAFATLADSLLALAGAVDIATGKLRQQLALEEVHVIEHQTGATVEPSPGSPEPARRNGRKTTASV